MGSTGAFTDTPFYELYDTNFELWVGRIDERTLYPVLSMRFSLIDLLLGVALGLLGVVPVLVAKHFLGWTPTRLSGECLVLFLGAVFYLIASPFIYQRLHLRPLWYPLCPKCKNANRFFHFPAAKPTWPREEVVCCTCGCSLELWYGPTPKDAGVSPTSRSFALVWPQSCGRWRRRDPPDRTS
jgi:hypothetical protein